MILEFKKIIEVQLRASMMYRDIEAFKRYFYQIENIILDYIFNSSPLEALVKIDCEIQSFLQWYEKFGQYGEKEIGKLMAYHKIIVRSIKENINKKEITH